MMHDGISRSDGVGAQNVFHAAVRLYPKRRDEAFQRIDEVRIMWRQIGGKESCDDHNAQDNDAK